MTDRDVLVQLILAVQDLKPVEVVGMHEVYREPSDVDARFYYRKDVHRIFNLVAEYIQTNKGAEIQ
jgi:hypothetical protein